MVRRLAEHFPDHTEYREPFVGGGSAFFHKPKVARNWLNDLHPGLYALFAALRDRFKEFAALCREQDGDRREMFDYWAGRTKLMRLHGDQKLVERAVQYFYINRTVWSGRVVYDPTRKSRLYFSNARGWNNLDKRLGHLAKISAKLQGVEITCEEFQFCFEGATADTFMYLDPPYMRDSVASRTDKLYDKEFPLEAHKTLKRLVAKTPAKVMISYDDCPETRALYKGKAWRIVELGWKYAGRYARTREDKAQDIKEKKVTGSELLIMNY